MKRYRIKVGDKFYHNNYATKKGCSLPDYLIVTQIKDSVFKDLYFIHAKYENHYMGTAERILSSIILSESNLNPKCKSPEWIFLTEDSQNLQPA